MTKKMETGHSATAMTTSSSLIVKHSSAVLTKPNKRPRSPMMCLDQSTTSTLNDVASPAKKKQKTSDVGSQNALSTTSEHHKIKFLPGTDFQSKYTLIKHIGNGSFGTVYAGNYKLILYAINILLIVL